MLLCYLRTEHTNIQHPVPGRKCRRQVDNDSFPQRTSKQTAASGLLMPEVVSLSLG